MASQVHMPLEEYLATGYEGPEPECLDGVIVERSIPNLPHADAQFRLSGVIFSRAQGGRLRGFTELRLKTGEGRLRVADLAR
jgi:hypothetical protein